MIDVHNEVGELRRVLVHAPGREVVRMTQFELEPLLFDDILSLDLAQQEHALLQEILGHQGAEVLEVRDVLRDALDRAPAGGRAQMLQVFFELAGVPELTEVVSRWPSDRLANAMIEGIAWSEVPDAPWTLRRIRARIDGPGMALAVAPLPNLMFMRDPCIAMFDRVVVGRMSTAARARESVLVHFALRYGLQDPQTGRSASFLFDDGDWERNPAFRALEGGDVLVLSDQVVLIGCSERTSAETIERLTADVLFPAFPRLERVHAVMMPRLRSVMHLDTILTAIDTKLFLGHAPMIEAADGLTVVQLERNRPHQILEGVSVADVLRRELGEETQVVPCGGDVPLHQLREQWTDGANAVCVAPGRIVLYARNVRTARTLVEKHGFRRVEVSAFQSDAERADRLAAIQPGDRVVYTFGGGELSRARGGGRCLTMPLARASL
jgi:arginine deiminase